VASVTENLTLRRDLSRRPVPDGTEASQGRSAKPAGGAACPNEDCSLFNRFNAGNLSIVEWIGKRKDRWRDGGQVKSGSLSIASQLVTALGPPRQGAFFWELTSD